MTLSRACKGLLTLAAVAGMMAFGMTPSARANLIVRASTDGGANYTTLISAPTGTAGFFTGPIGGFAITLETAGSNSAGTPTMADLVSATLSLTNVNNATGNIIFQMSDIDFVRPATAPLLLTENVSGTVVLGNASNTITYQGWVDTSNTQFGMGGPTPGPISANITGVPKTVFGNSASIFITSDLPTPFSMTKEKDIHLAIGSTVNFATSLDLTPAPEPGTLVLALMAGPVLGLGYWRQRRRARA